MALALTDEHLQLAGAVRGWARRRCPPERVRAAAGERRGGSAWYLEALAPALAGQGMLGLHLPEADGGQGFGLPELAVAVEELGRALVPGVFLPTVLASAVLFQAGGAGGLIRGLADGSKAGAVGLAPGLTGRGGPGGGLVLDGESGPVLGGCVADLVILPVATGSGETWLAADAASLTITEVDSLDLGRPLARVRAEGTVVPAARLLAGVGRESVASTAATLFGAEACGIAGWAVHAAAEHAKLRRQFGRPIGQFQAVKHRCARMLAAAERAAAAVWDAARAGQAAVVPDTAQPGCGSGGSELPGAERDFAAAVAAVVALDAAVSCVHECIQVLGGIGYTWEHPAHLYYRRAMSLRSLLGSSASWQARVAELALAGTTRPARPELPAAEGPLRTRIRAELAEIAPLRGKDRAGRLAAGGWVMPHLPRPWGRDAGALEQIVTEQEMRSCGVRAPGLAIGAWVVPALVRHGTREQQDRFLPPTLRADFLWCQLFSEPGAGSDLAGLSSRAERAEGGWKITGQKIWTSLAREASWAICLARTDPAAPRHDGITYFLLDMSTPGVQVRPLREITGDSIFNQVFLDDVFVPDDCVVGDVNGGWKVARTTLANERVSLSRTWEFGAGVPELLSAARAAADPPLADVGQLVAEGHAIDMLSLRAALKQLSGTDPGATGSIGKLLAMRHAQQVAELCWAMSGPAGALGSGLRPPAGAPPPDGAHWARQVLLTRALTIGGGTTDIQLNIIAERMLGLPRDPEPPPA